MSRRSSRLVVDLRSRSQEEGPPVLTVLRLHCRLLPLAVLFVFLSGLPPRAERAAPSHAEAASPSQASKAPCSAERKDAAAAAAASAAGPPLLSREDSAAPRRSSSCVHQPFSRRFRRHLKRRVPLSRPSKWDSASERLRVRGSGGAPRGEGAGGGSENRRRQVLREDQLCPRSAAAMRRLLPRGG